MKSSLFLHNVTHVDCAVINDKGLPTGLSFVPVFKVTGDITGDEQVVMDFSKLKKQLKALIDDKENGYDHKFIVLSQEPAEKPANGEFSLTFPDWSLTCPYDAVKTVVVTDNTTDGLLAIIAKDMANYLSRATGFEVECYIAEPEFASPNGLPHLCGETNAIAYSFEYTHGLPKSSSFGCQNIMHGHAAYLHLGSNRSGRTEEAQEFVDASLASLAELIATYLDEGYFVCKDHVTKHKDGHYTVEYVAERGHFKLSLPKEYNVVVMENEPTIENIVKHVSEVFKAELKENRVTSLAISEGLWKGSVETLPYTV